MTHNPGPPWLVPRTAYIHIPFCGHHCGYCDFAVTAGQDHLIELYLEAVALELRSLGEPRPIETHFVGGGTPTYLTAPQLARLFADINHWFPRIGDRPEVSIESTPESLDEEKVRVLADLGVTRVSVGVQSFHDRLLQSLDRRHGVTHIPRAVAAVRKFVPDLSFDLIFASPGQTLAEWDADLSAALEFEPDHISTYGLTYEKGTPLWKARERGHVAGTPEDVELEMYLHAIDRLTAAGFEHYEISNFAKPGKRSRHNQRYWANEAYFGLGVGAAWYVGGRRGLNVRNTNDYIRRILAGESATFQVEELPPRERAFETIATQLRRIDGIDREQFREQTGFPLDDLVGERIRTHVAGRLLSDIGVSVILTPQGKCVADGVIADLMKSAGDAKEPPEQRLPRRELATGTHQERTI